MPNRSLSLSKLLIGAVAALIFVALFTVPVLRATLPADAERIARIGELVGAPALDGTVLERAEAGVEAVANFVASVGMDRSLQDLGGDASLVEPLADDVTSYMSRPLKQHPVVFDHAAIADIVRATLA